MSRAIVAAFSAVLGMSSAIAPHLGVSIPRLYAPSFSEGIPVRSPATVGMSAERLAAVDRVVLSGINAGGFPGAAVVVGRDGYAVVKRGYGRLTWSAESAPVTEQSIYDLASLTKVVATTSAIMVLYDEGKIDLDAPVRHYVPAFSGGAKDRVTVRHLLMHRSGLPAGRDLWRSASSPAEARRQVLETRLVCAPGACYEYSDLGADVLAFVAETVSGQRLDAFVEERVFGPLGMNDTFFRPPAEVRGRTAPTEIAPPRGYPLRGEVHDENAYALGGVAGHAGLFSTAADLSIFAQTLLDGGAYRGVRVFADSTVRLFSRRAGAGTRALGWDTCDGKGSCGSVMGQGAFGHTGFTGTSMWLDPEQRMFVVLLTNRVYEARAARPARVIADVRADLADAAELAVTDDPSGIRAMPAVFRADEANGWQRVSTPAPRVASRGSSRSSSRAASKRSVRGERAVSRKGAKAATRSDRQRGTVAHTASARGFAHGSARSSSARTGAADAAKGSARRPAKATARGEARSKAQSTTRGKAKGSRSATRVAGKPAKRPSATRGTTSVASAAASGRKKAG